MALSPSYTDTALLDWKHLAAVEQHDTCTWSFGEGGGDLELEGFILCFVYTIKAVRLIQDSFCCPLITGLSHVNGTSQEAKSRCLLLVLQITFVVKHVSFLEKD